MAILNKRDLSNSMDSAVAPLIQRFARLSRRDQLALSILMAFLLLFTFGFGGWTLHQKANARQKDYDKTLADIFWLRSQAGNINQNQSAQLANKSDAVRQSLTQLGIQAQVVENNGAIQVSFSHPQPAVVNNVFNQFTQQGLTIRQLQINQPSVDKLEVQALLN